MGAPVGRNNRIKPTVSTLTLRWRSLPGHDMIRHVTIGLAILVGCFVVYRVGVGVMVKVYSKGLSETQAMLAFNHMRQFEDLLHCLEKGAVEPTAERLRHAIVGEKELVAEFLRRTDSDKVNDYISVRYDTPIDELKNFSSTRRGSWQVSPCK